MSTNYYVKTGPCANSCQHCRGQKYHLGKSAMGWSFHFKADRNWEREDALMNWMTCATSGQIEKEDGTEVSFQELMSVILHCSGPTKKRYAAEYPEEEKSYLSYGQSFTTYNFC